MVIQWERECRECEKAKGNVKSFANHPIHVLNCHRGVHVQYEGRLTLDENRESTARHVRDIETPLAATHRETHQTEQDRQKKYGKNGEHGRQARFEQSDGGRVNIVIPREKCAQSIVWCQKHSF